MGNATRIAARQTINGDGARAGHRSPAQSAEKRARGGGRFFFSLTLALVLAAVAILALPRDAHAVEVGDFEVTLTEGGGNPEYGTDYEYDSNVLTVKSPAPLIISMKNGVPETTTDTIVTEAEGATVTLKDVRIDVSGVLDTVAMSVKSGSLDLVLAGETGNFLKSASGRAGLENNKLPLSISGLGSLEAHGGDAAAGIGGNGKTLDGAVGSNITISGNAQVTATGGTGGTDDAGGAGIGGGGKGNGTGISISGGYVKATAGNGADPIGGGFGKRGTSGVTVTGGAFADGVAADGTVYGVEPVSGYALGANEDSREGDYPWRVYSTGDFDVWGGAYGTDYEYGPFVVGDYNILTVKTSTPLTISMKDGVSETTTDTVVTSDDGANVTLAGVNIDVSGKDDVAAMSIALGTTLDLTLAEGTTSSLKSGERCAGLQNNGRGATLIIFGSGSLEAQGGESAAGIGGKQTHPGVNIAIRDSARVTAIGGTYAAGIGGGEGGFGDNIAISGGYVKAVPGTGADPIGGGQYDTGAGGVTITGGAFADAGWAENAVYGVTLAESHVAAANNDADEALRTDYPVRVFEVGVVTLALDDSAPTPEYSGSPVDLSVLLETAERGDEDVSDFVTWSYRMAGSDGGYTDGAPTNVGSYDVRATLPALTEGGAYYPQMTAEVRVAISPQTLTATVRNNASATKPYDGTSAFEDVELTLTGAVAGESVTAAADGTAASKDAGIQVFTATAVTLGGTHAANYSLAVSGVSGTVTIEKRVITPFYAQVANKAYDGTTTATLEEVFFFGIALDETLVLDKDYTASASFEDANVGNDKQVLVTVFALVEGGPIARNYNLRSSPESFWTRGNITKGTPTIKLTVNDNPTYYGDWVTFTVASSLGASSPSTRARTEMTFQFYVVDADETERIFAGSREMVEEANIYMDVNYNTAVKGLSIGPNTVYVRTSGTDNLKEAVSDPVTVTLLPKTVTPTVSVAGTTIKPYDGSTDLPAGAVPTVELDGVLADDSVSATASYAFASPDAGTTQVNATGVMLSGADADFYTLSADTASATVAGGITPADAFNLTPEATMPNYLLNYEKCIDLTDILPVGATDATLSVDPTASYNGLVSAHVEGNELVLVADDAGNTTSDEVSVAVTSMNNYENSTITVAVSYTAKPMAYFAIQSVDGTYTGAPQAGFVAPAGATYIAPDGTERVYTGPFEARYRVASPGPSPSTTEPPTAVGTYEVTVSLPDDAPCAGSATVTFEIAKAPLTVTALDAAAVYGDAAPLFEASFDGFVAAEGAGALAGELAFACAYDAGDPVGSYAITASGLSSDNYAISYKPGMLAISPKALSATVDAADPSASKSHDDTPGFQDVKLVLAGALDGDDVSGVADGAAADAAAGEGKPFAASTVRLSGDDMRNYVLDPADVTGTVTIVAAPAPEPEPTPDPEPLPAPNGGSGSGSGEKPAPLPGTATALAPTGDATAALAFAALALAALSTAVLVAARLRHRTD